MKRILTILALAVAALTLSAAAIADPGDHGKDGKGKAGHAKYTFTVVTTDNGSCGTPWAKDTVVRTFTVKDNGDGTYRLTRSDRGVFTTIGGVSPTIGGVSPGACEKKGHHGKTVRAGVKGKLVGFITGTITGGKFDPTATAPVNGFTDTFIAAYFGAAAQFSCFTNSTDCKFNFNYTAAKHQSLLFRHWQDKGKGAGTKLVEEFHGDIADH